MAPFEIDQLLNAALGHHRARAPAPAETLCRQILAHNPDHDGALHLLGVLALQSNRLDLAIENLRRASLVNPTISVYSINLGTALTGRGRLDEAIACYRRALELAPDFAEVHNNLGNALHGQNKLDEAIACYRRALELKPSYYEAHNNLGVALSDQGKLDEAVACYRRALELKPDYAEAHNSLGVALKAQGKLDGAAACYRRALELAPNFPDARKNWSYLLLLQGDFDRGWSEFEWRWKCKAFTAPKRSFAQPQWDGGNLDGRTILLHAEQGIGDTLQFIRYAPLVAQMGAKVIAECQPHLKRLLHNALPHISLLDAGKPLPPFDVHCPLLSLPLAFRTTLATIPRQIPYLHADAEWIAHWRSKLEDEAKLLKVGLVWAGNKTHKNDRNRSLTLEILAPLGRVPGVRFYSLQKGEQAEQTLRLPADMPFVDWTNEIDDFADTAALIAHLDLVITVDTAVAHLAGAMGKPVWTLLPFAPDWRWLLDREDSPWYPTMRLFRQSAAGDWPSVVERVADALRRWAAGEVLAPPRSADVAPATPAAAPLTETDRRKQTIARKETDVERWRNPNQLMIAWDKRAQFAADMLPAGAAVLDLGCGRMALEGLLPPYCTYIPCDVVVRDPRTIVCDFNAGQFPHADNASHIAVLGVIEYLYDVPALLRKLRQTGRSVILSYNPTDGNRSLDRPALGWVNHLSLPDLEKALNDADLHVAARQRIDDNQFLLRLNPGLTAPAPRLNVVVVSAFGIGNFGDRLGYHLINDVLPAHATVHHANVNFPKACRIDGVPEGDIDLLVLGIGNSLFGPMLNDSLLELLERPRRTIGIFGTQYRQKLDRGRLNAVLDHLHTWYARYEEDILIYGKGRSNIVHLGDWLIDAFPMARGETVETLSIGVGKEMWNDLPLDRTIQRIQAHRYVYSLRLHPLLCAMTSAEQVAYREQRGSGDDLISGKFRALLIDVFGRTYPEDQFFMVDRDAVVAYKVKVQQEMVKLRRALSTLGAKSGLASPTA